MIAQLPKFWGRVLVYGCGVPAWQFRVLDKFKNPVEDYTAEFVMKRSPADATFLKKWTTTSGLNKVGAIGTFTGTVDVKVEDVVIGGWFKIGNGPKIPIQYDYFKILINTTPDA